MRQLTWFVTILLALGPVGCATVTGGVEATAVARLEDQQRSRPASAPVNRALGIAYFHAARYLEARAALETATRLDPQDGTTALYLGLTAEAQNDLPAARRAYSSYLQYGRTSRVRAQLQARLAALARRELVADAKAAVAQEAMLSAEIGSPQTVAVMPLRFTGSDTTLRSLERGFADLLTTDLARSSQLTLVERSRLQALLDEIALQKSGATEASTSARAGRLLRAGRMVQGSLLQIETEQLTNPQLRIDAAVVDVPTTLVQGTVQAADQLSLLFDLEKRLALDLLRQMGVTLTVAERNAIEQRPTRSLAAFLAYSRGLVSEDAGDYDAASRYFNQAVRIDPAFSAAQTKGEATKQASIGATVTAQTVEATLKGSVEQRVKTAAIQGQVSGTGTNANAGTTLGSSVAETAGALNTSSAGALTGSATAAVAPPPPPPSTQGGTPPVQSPAIGKVVFTFPRIP